MTANVNLNKLNICRIFNNFSIFYLFYDLNEIKLYPIC